MTRHSNSVLMIVFFLPSFGHAFILAVFSGEFSFTDNICSLVVSGFIQYFQKHPVQIISDSENTHIHTTIYTKITTQYRVS